MNIPSISKAELQKVAIVGCHLHSFITPKRTKIQDIKADLRSLIQNQGIIQLDPLNPAGRNHDIFCSCRLKSYRYALFEKTLYPEKLVFENYFHLLNVIDRTHLPLFYPLRTYEHTSPYYKKRIDNLKKTQPKLLDQVYQFIQDHGPVSSQDLLHFGKATPGMKIWKSSTKAGSALEFLWVLGKIAVVKRDGQFKKYYDMIEKQFPPEFRQTDLLPSKDLAYKRLQLLLRSFPVINAKFSISKGGKFTPPRSKKTWFHKLETPIENLVDNLDASPNEIHPTLVNCEDTNRVYFVPSNYQDFIDEVYDDEMRAIAPLDPLIHDRDLTKALFDFEYLWEVYKPFKERRWGYYVYPLLWHGKFIGRFEAKFDKTSKVLTFSNFSKEKGIKLSRSLLNAMQRLMERWQKMMNAKNIEFDQTIPTKS